MSSDKKRLERLKKIRNSGIYTGDQNMKDIVKDGRYAVLSVRNPVFDNITCANNEEQARAIVRYNYNSFARIIDLDNGEVVSECVKHWIPVLSIDKE